MSQELENNIIQRTTDFVDRTLQNRSLVQFPEVVFLGDEWRGIRCLVENHSTPSVQMLQHNLDVFEDATRIGGVLRRGIYSIDYRRILLDDGRKFIEEEAPLLLPTRLSGEVKFLLVNYLAAAAISIQSWKVHRSSTENVLTQINRLYQDSNHARIYGSDTGNSQIFDMPTVVGYMLRGRISIPHTRRRLGL